MKKNKNDIVKKDDDGTPLKSEAFMIEDRHPVIGRILIVDGHKYKIMSDAPGDGTGTFIKAMTEEDERRMQEYDDELDELSEKLVDKIDIKRMIKEQIKNKQHDEIKTGLYILKRQKEGEKVEVEHNRGCYHMTMYYKNQKFDIMSGCDVVNDINEIR
jgi:hypothetical protein